MRGETGERGGKQMEEPGGKGLKGEVKHYGLFGAVLPGLSQHYSSL